MQPFGQLLLILIFLQSCFFWWQTAVKTMRGEAALPWRERKPQVWHPAATLLAIFWIALPVIVWVADLSEIKQEPSLSQVRFSCLLSAVIVMIFMAVLSQSSRYKLSDFGIEIRGTLDQIQFGVIGFIASVLPVIALLLLSYPFREIETQHSFFKVLREESGLETFIWIAMAAVLLAPLAEELIFRVVLQGALRRWLSPRWAIPIVALLFSGVHGWPDMLPLMPLALILGYIYHRRNSFLAVVVTHSLFNAMNLFMALLTYEPEGAGNTTTALLRMITTH